MPRRRVNRNPLQVSSTEQTLVSTRPTERPQSRTTRSLRSLETPEDFFGHASHSAPVVESERVSCGELALEARASRIKGQHEFTRCERRSTQGRAERQCDTKRPRRVNDVEATVRTNAQFVGEREGTHATSLTPSHRRGAL